KSVAFPMAARVPKPGWRPILAVRHSFGVDCLEHGALFEEESDVFIVLKNLHGMWRKRADPAERHAASRVITIFDLVVVVPLRLAPWREGKGIGLAFVARTIPVCKSSRQIL